MTHKTWHILDNISLHLPSGEVRRQLHLQKDQRWEEVKNLIKRIEPDIKGKAFYRVCFIDEKEDDTIVIKGCRFRSRVLAKNLQDVQRVFPFVVTLGDDFMFRMDAEKDLVLKYYLDVIGNVALRSVRNYLETQIQKRYGLEGMSFMSPGSLKDWPIHEQRPLFNLLGQEISPIGVTLNNSCLMIPAKSVSGIYFPTEVPFFSCQLCDRPDCPGRKAAYDADIAAEYH